MSGHFSPLDRPVVVVGAGIGGLATALRLAPRPVLVVSKGALGAEGSTNWAQGGLAASVGGDDDAEQHAADTVAAGDGLCEEEVVRRFAHAAPAAIEQLAAWGVRFDRDADGRLRTRPRGGASTSPHRSRRRRRHRARDHAGARRGGPPDAVDRCAGRRGGAPAGRRRRKNSRRRRRERGREPGDRDGRRRAGDRRRRRPLRRQHQPARQLRAGAGAGRARRRGARRPRIRAVSSDRLAGGDATRAADHRSRARRRRDPRRRRRRALHGRHSRPRAGGPRRGRSRDLAKATHRAARVSRRARDRRPVRVALSFGLCDLRAARHRSDARSHSRQAGRALPHGRDRRGPAPGAARSTGCGRAARSRAPVCTAPIASPAIP